VIRVLVVSFNATLIFLPPGCKRAVHASSAMAAFLSKTCFASKTNYYHHGNEVTIWLGEFHSIPRWRPFSQVTPCGPSVHRAVRLSVRAGLDRSVREIMSRKTTSPTAGDFASRKVFTNTYRPETYSSISTSCVLPDSRSKSRAEQLRDR